MQLTLFESHDTPLRRAVESVDVDSLTPLQALQTLADLRKLL
jgi:hypothetical protein